MQRLPVRKAGSNIYLLVDSADCIAVAVAIIAHSIMEACAASSVGVQDGFDGILTEALVQKEQVRLKAFIAMVSLHARVIAAAFYY